MTLTEINDLFDKEFSKIMDIIPNDRLLHLSEADHVLADWLSEKFIRYFADGGRNHQIFQVLDKVMEQEDITHSIGKYVFGGIFFDFQVARQASLREGEIEDGEFYLDALKRLESTAVSFYKSNFYREHKNQDLPKQLTSVKSKLKNLCPHQEKLNFEAYLAIQTEIEQKLQLLQEEASYRRQINTIDKTAVEQIPSLKAIGRPRGGTKIGSRDELTLTYSKLYAELDEVPTMQDLADAFRVSLGTVKNSLNRFGLRDMQTLRTEAKK